MKKQQLIDRWTKEQSLSELLILSCSKEQSQQFLLDRVTLDKGIKNKVLKPLFNNFSHNPLNIDVKSSNLN